jgi:hypothetical protein
MESQINKPSQEELDEQERQINEVFIPDEDNQPESAESAGSGGAGNG